MKKEKKKQADLEWATAQIVLPKKESVLQESAVWLGKKLYCKTRCVLQYEVAG